MVCALLAGTKTQTRRVITEPRAARLHGRSSAPSLHFADPGLGGGAYLHWFYTGGDLGNDACSTRVPCPYGVPGDRLWVRETFDAPPGSEGRSEVAYRADYQRDPPDAT